MIAAVIVTYNGERWIGDALDSLRSSEAVASIFVIDNCSSDGTREKIDGGPKTRLICKSKNLGFGRANNEGISEALSRGAEYILLLNQDARVSPDCVEILRDTMQRHPEYGIVSPVHLTLDGSAIDPHFLSYMTADPQILSDLCFGKAKELYEVPFTNAAAWMVSRGVFEKTGGFDPLFFLYGEDGDYCRRARYHGFKIGIAPAAFAYHRHGLGDKSALSLRSRINWQYAGMVHAMKLPGRSFLRNCAGTASWCLREEVHDVFARDMRGCIASLAAAGRCLSNLAQIRKHYRLSRTEGPHWLNF